MKEETEIVAATPGDFADAERAVFSKLVLAGGEVGGAVLERNIASAKALVFLRRAQEVQGIAALKRPQTSYRKRIGGEAGTKIAMDRFPYELGYVFLLPEAQGKRLSHALVAAALERADGAGVFSTTRIDNAAMLATLTKAGFTPAGEPYRGIGTRMIRLLLRAAEHVG